MQVPLAAERTIAQGRQMLTIWSAGEPHLVPAPFLPYCFAKTPFAAGPSRQTSVTVRPLSHLRDEAWTKAEFATVKDLASTAHQLPPGEVADANIPFIHRVLLDQPDFFRGWANGPPRVMVFDIEQLTAGKRFPKREDPLISIAWAVDAGEPECVLGDGRDDAEIIESFLSAIRRTDPDLIAGYNVKGYDLPTLLTRMERQGLDVTRLTRAGGRVDKQGRDDEPRLVGRLLYDVYDSVRLDQTLFGIKDRKLKTVAKWRGIPVIEEDTTNTAALVGTERLRRYNVSDVVATRAIASPYLANLVELADFYGAPLATVLEATPNFHCTVLQGRIMVRRGVVSDGTNGERYPALYAGNEGEGFVGGIVEIYQRGLFRPLTKVDFASMYPSILVALGAGADNTRYLGTVPVGKYEAKRRGSTLELLIPDPARGTRHRVTIEGRSELAQQLGDLLRYRLDLKGQVKGAADEAARARATARQGMVKVILNSVYGVMASRHARYGSLPVAMAIVGTARHLIRDVEGMLGDAKIETDTDGVYASGVVDAAPIDAQVNRFVEDVLGGEPILRVEAETFEAGWFHQGKNYVLLHEDGRLETHGVAFKGSSRAPLFDKGLDKVARALLTGHADMQRVAAEVLDLASYGPEDFIMRVRLGKDLEDYDAPNHLVAQVARAARARGQEPRPGEQLAFVRTKDGYDVAWEGAFARLDLEYYQESLGKLLARLGVDVRLSTVARGQKNLADFL